ncbi:hypothetical protein BS50DRAFT_484447 [Corynespora cassiicola Philippines]|uniref:C2H2-type domain-containing protein n=1 Tax=Corynespora cassiicola Philippines TaxID=1448308 RepID=A0A2T2P410_CORCC|nr:hypothetical protein BS50DRAFT_484447 [Corynespora cassiicola Philippines]
MSDPSETSGRPLASTTLQPEANPQSTALLRKRRKASLSSDEPIASTKSTLHRHPVSRKEASFRPQPGSSRGDTSTMQRSTSPTQMSPDSTVHYTRTGRISKAKKGLKVHNCECGRSYTRAEHLRRHQKNHNENALTCEVPECGKTFFRIDLLQRHQERHNEIAKEPQSNPFINHTPSAEPEPQVTTPVTLPAAIVTTSQAQSPYYTQTAVPESPAVDPRYTTSNPFLTPRLPSSISSSFGHVLRSSPSSKSSPNSGKHRSTFTPRRTHATMAYSSVPGDAMVWNESYSPQCTDSSGYPSPMPEYYFAGPPYGAGANRTRTPSNASFIGEPWAMSSRSPTSATSTMGYTWTSNEKAPSNLAYMNMATSYPMTSVPMVAHIDPVYQHGHFGPKSLAQRDEEEQAFLFADDHYGMDHTAPYTYSSHLDNYWRHFHPGFPVVHRSTFESMNGPPMLRAAMIALGGQYSNDASTKRKSRILHDRCLKLLDKRDLDVTTEPERLADYQALFLIEVLSQYRARRAAKSLSTRFEGLYHQLCNESTAITPAFMESSSAISQTETPTVEQWVHWVDLAGRQRLLLCCYLLEYQQVILLARTSHQSIAQLSEIDLPFPVHSSVWDATQLSDWASALQQCPRLPVSLFDTGNEMSNGQFDTFQSSLLIATHFNRFSNPTSYSSVPSTAPCEHLLEDSAMVKYHLLTAKLVQVTPIRALLGVSGESWILSEKVSSSHAFQSLKTTLRGWANGLWTSPAESPAKEALKLAIELLQHAMITQTESLRLELGADMGLYFASLVVWAVTAAAHARMGATQSQTQPHRYQSHSPLPAHQTSNQYPSTPSQLSVSSAGASPDFSHAGAYCLLANSHGSSAPAPTSNSMLHDDMLMMSFDFTTQALIDVGFLGQVPQWPPDVMQWQKGCTTLMRWVKMRLRRGTIEVNDTIPTITITGGGGDGHGELLDGVISSLEKIMNRGWEGTYF